MLVYSKTVEEHREYLRRLFDTLRKNKLYVRRSKCNIGVPEVAFLGYKVSEDGLYMQKRIMDAILDWPTPTSVNDVGQFIGLANFYRRYIKEYSKLLQAISDLLRNKAFKWTEPQEKAFENIKQALTSCIGTSRPR